MLVQVAMAGAAGLAVAAKLGWQRVSGKFSRKSTTEDDTTAEAPSEG